MPKDITLADIPWQALRLEQRGANVYAVLEYTRVDAAGTAYGRGTLEKQLTAAQRTTIVNFVTTNLLPDAKTQEGMT